MVRNLPIDALQKGTSLNATELVCTVSPDNIPTATGHLRSEMRLNNLWHRATYVLIRHGNSTSSPSSNSMDYKNSKVLVQRRSMEKDYCPGKLDPTPGGVVGFNESYQDNAIRELHEEMGITIPSKSNDHQNDNKNHIQRLFTFSYEDDQVRVWGDFYEAWYYGSIDDLIMQPEEVEEIIAMTLGELKEGIKISPEAFMPDSCHAMKLYFQRQEDVQVKRRLLKGYSSGDLDRYGLRTKPQVVFFDCDDTLYFDDWMTATKLTEKIESWCVDKVGLKRGQAYELYKKYGTALRGLLAEGYIENSPSAIDEFLSDVHDLPIHELIQPDPQLRELLLRMDPSIPKFIFTASVSHHARRCLKALGIDDLFPNDDCIIDVKSCNLETKHSQESFKAAMKIAGVADPEACIFFDDSMKNIKSARDFGWRSVLVGKIGRDCGKPISSEDAELEIHRIHEFDEVLPELFRGFN